MRHGLAGVHRQVHQDLLDMRRIGGNHPQIVLKPGFQAHIFTDQTLQHLLDMDNHLIQQDWLLPRNLLAAESQKLSSQG